LVKQINNLKQIREEIMTDSFLACAYCGELMDMPSEEILEKFGDIALECCDFKMITLNRSNLYKLLKGVEKLKSAIENEIIKDF